MQVLAHWRKYVVDCERVLSRELYMDAERQTVKQLRTFR